MLLRFPLSFVVNVLLFQFLCVSCTNDSSCTETERRALLKFKHSFQEDPFGMLSSWQGNHCCQWEGVGCDDNTGHVTMLNLRNAGLLAGELNSSLVELQHLSYLDLGGNDFQHSHILGFLGSMKRLRFLGLSYANFSGSIPGELGNLSSLQHLELSSWGVLHVDSFEWASNLLSLKYLDMSEVNMTKVESISMKVLATLPSLTNLTLIGCELQNIEFDHTSSSSVNSTFFTSLEHLDLSYNHLTQQSLMSVLRNMTSLKLLDLSNNNFNSSVPYFLRDLKKLVHLDLRENSFNRFEEGGLMSMLDGVCSLKSLDLSHNIIKSLAELESNNNYNTSSHCANYDLEFMSLEYNEISSQLPGWLVKLALLKHLDLSGNSIHGPFPHLFEKLTSLTHLDLSNNLMNGTIPISIGRLLSLEELDLSNNHLIGLFPTFLGKLTSLTHLDLSNNHLIGLFPTFLGKLSHLETLDVSFNSLQGIVTEIHFANLSNLKILNIKSNNLTCKMRSDWIPSFQLNQAQMSGCKVGSRLPQWLRTQNEVNVLTFANADIVGTFPNWLQSFPLITLDLSGNRISGSLPSYFGAMTELGALILGSNFINGSIPKSLCKLDVLMALDLSKNMFSGEIPDCLGVFQNDLMFIKLSENELSGTVPISIGNLHRLLWLQVNNNNLNGELPLAMRNCTQLQILDLGGNQLSGAIPDWIGENLVDLILLRLRNNIFTGNIPKTLCESSSLQILDLANNHLDGKITPCFSNLTGMSGYPVKGHTPGFVLPGETSILLEDIKVWEVMKGRDLEYNNLILLTYMDLSSNKLQGFIPTELFVLVKLKGLNLSYNHLSGNIPNQIGNLTSLESLDFSNNKLSGPIPSTLSKLTMLAHLNFSNNNLSGRVPTGNQLQTLDNNPSIYAGNPQLCGDKLPHKCSNDHTNGGDSSSTAHDKEEEEEDRSERIWLYLAISLGYAFGLWVVMMTLCLKRKWRIAYFRFAENAKDRIIVIVSVNWTRLKRMMDKAEE